MNRFSKIISVQSNWQYPLVLLLFTAIFFILIIIYNIILKKVEKKAQKTNNPIDDFIIRLFKFPAISLIFSVLLSIFSSLLKDNGRFFNILREISEILLTLAIGWLLIQTVRAFFRYFQNKYNMNNADNLEARKRLTQIGMIEKIVIFTVAIIFISIALMTIDSLRNIGMSILTSAGVLGIIVGLAAQRSVGQVLSGIQIALTQPVRLDDVVIVEGEWGHIEEINITYLVVKVWDERRLIVPIDYFLQKPIQNWTKNSADIMGTIFLYVSYDLPLKPVREYLKTLVEKDPNWDGRVQNIQVTGSKEWYKEIRILVSSSDSSKNWSLRVEVREKIIDFINEKFPGSFAKVTMQKPV